MSYLLFFFYERIIRKILMSFDFSNLFLLPPFYIERYKMIVISIIVHTKNTKLVTPLFALAISRNDLRNTKLKIFIV